MELFSTEKESLTKQVERLEQEGRMILPGIQALFGFQLIAVFNNGFFERLELEGRYIHFAAIIFTALSTAIIMTPAAYHRQIEPGKSSQKFIQLASRLICFSMIFLSLAIALDIGVIAWIVTGVRATAYAMIAGTFLLYFFCWFIFPRLRR